MRKRITVYSPSKFLVYRPNGSGRDSYISTNSGGFRAEGSNNANSSFQHTLRDVMPNLNQKVKRSLKSRKINLSENSWFTPRIKKNFDRVEAYQFRRSKQLSVPRNREKVLKDAFIKQALSKMVFKKQNITQ